MNASDTPNDIHLKKIQQAIEQSQVVQMQYFSPSSGGLTARTIEPIEAIYEDNVWRIKAYCQLRQGYREFRLDRMSKLRLDDKARHRQDDTQ
ncbi:MAG: WYL domain-containing protein [Tunicatimonas sp.]